MEKKKMGTDSDTHHSRSDWDPADRSRVTDTGASYLYSILSLFKNILSFLLPTLVFIVVLEALFRLLNLPPYPVSHNRNLYVQNDFSNFALSPHYFGYMTNLEYKNRVYTDNLGFRNSHAGDIEIQKNKYRVLLAGDSMTFGQGVRFEDSFAGLLAKNNSYQIFNEGVPSYGTINSLGLLKKTGNTVKPNLVIYVLYPGNDFYDNARGFAKHVIDGYLTEDPNFRSNSIKNEDKVDYSAYTETKYFNTFDEFFLKVSALYKFFRYKASFIPSIRPAYVKKGIIDLARCGLPYSPSPFMKGYTNENEYKKTISLISEMKDYSEKNLKAKFVLLMMPVREQINQKLLEYEEHLGCVKKKDFVVHYPNTYLKHFAKQNHIDFIDPTGNLETSFNQRKNPYFVIDTHLNTIGHEVLYQTLSTYLQKVVKK